MLVAVHGLTKKYTELNGKQCTLLYSAVDPNGVLYWKAYCATGAKDDKIYMLREKNMSFVESKKPFSKGEKVLVKIQTSANLADAQYTYKVCVLQRYYEAGRGLNRTDPLYAGKWRVQCADVKKPLIMSEQNMVPLHM